MQLLQEILNLNLMISSSIRNPNKQLRCTSSRQKQKRWNNLQIAFQNFLEILNKNFPSIDTVAKETYFLGDFNINMYEKSKYIVHKNSTVCTKFTSTYAK